MAYTPKTWRDYPSTETMVMASDLNRIEKGIDDAHKDLEKKIDTPETTGTADQVLTLGADGKPVWSDPSAEITVDDALSDTSENPVQNKVIKAEIDKKANTDDVPAEVTEQTITNWGFTKNTGTYSKPDDGIPKTDLASAVQTSLGKADTAIQSTADCVKTSGNQTVAGIKTFTGNPVFQSANFGESITNKRTDANDSSICFQNSAGTKGYIGVTSTGLPAYYNPSKTRQNLVRQATADTAVGSASKPVYINANGIATAITSYEGNSATATTATNANNLKVFEHSTNNITYYPIWANGEGGTGTNRQCFVTKDKLKFVPATGTLSATTFSGNLSGTATSATKATQDGNGNNIVNTYATKTYATTAGFPSDKSLALTIGASGAEYTAPADGYIYVGWYATAVGGWVVPYNATIHMDGTVTRSTGGGDVWWYRATVQASQGDKVIISYDAAHIDFIVFVYAKGAK